MEKEIATTNELSFNKRIALTKKEVFELVQREQMDKAGNGKSGYYSIKTIMSAFNSVSDKYNVDLDIQIMQSIDECALIDCTWIDCMSESTRTIKLDCLKAIAKIERLAAMQNIIQSQGAILTYYRRYALTNVFGLNATDLIENSVAQKQAPAQQQNKDYKISEKQQKFLFAKSSEREISKEQIKEYLKKSFNVESSKDLTKSQMDKMLSDLEKMPLKGEIKK